MPIQSHTFKWLTPFLIVPFVLVALILELRSQSTGDYGGGSTQPSPGNVFRAGTGVNIGVTGNVVTISGTSSGTGAAAVTNANNYFMTSSTNIFNGKTLMPGGIYNNAYELMIDSQNGRLRHSSGISYAWTLFTQYDQNGFISHNHDTRELFNNNEESVAKYNIGQLTYTSGNPSVMWINGELANSAGTVTANYNTQVLSNGWTLGSIVGNTTFNGSTYAIGTSNVLGTSTTSNFFKGAFFFNTNAAPSYAFAAFKPISIAKPYMVLDSGSSSLNAGWVIGNVAGTDALELSSDGSGNLRILGFGAPLNIQGSGATISIQPNTGSTMLSVSTSGAVIGLNSSSAHVFNGSTWTIANTPQINTDVLKIPSAGGTITNGTRIVSTKGATATPLHLTPGVPATSVDFEYKEQILNNTTNLTLSSANLSPGSEVTLKIFNDSNARTLTVPAGWIAANTPIPTGFTASKVTTLYLSCTGTTDSSVLVYTSQQP